jgi:hypothetical protein
MTDKLSKEKEASGLLSFIKRALHTFNASLSFCIPERRTNRGTGWAFWDY